MSFDLLLLIAFIVSGLLSIYYAVMRQDATEKKRKIIDFWREICLFSGAIGLFRLFYQIFPNISPDTIFFTLTILALGAYLFYVMRGNTESALKNRKLFRDIFFCLLVVFSFRGIFYDYFYIPSKSMLPTLTVGDLVLTDKKAYGYRLPVFYNYLTEGREPERGEIIVFRHPQKEIFYIKRIVGIPGDTLHYSEEKRLYINGEPLSYTNTDTSYEGIPRYKEKINNGWHDILIENSINLLYISPDKKACDITQTDKGNSIICKVPAGQYFTLGDNRDHSNDSRYWGFVPKDNIVGPAKLILFNFNGFNRFLDSLALEAE